MCLVLGFVGRSGAVPANVKPQAETFGHSVQGRPLVAYVLGNGSDVTAVFGAFHGDERQTPGVVRRLMRYLEDHPDEVQNRTVILVPVANPDGLHAGTRVNAHGVDLNRNFPVDWHPQGSSVRYSPGATPESEPETQAIAALMKRYQPAKVISIHQPLNRLIYSGPFGKSLAAVMQTRDGLPITDHSVRPTPGSFGQYCGDGLKSSIVTVELGRHVSAAQANMQKDALMAAIRVPLSSLAAAAGVTPARRITAGKYMHRRQRP